MSWVCRLVSNDVSQGHVDLPGDMWFAPWMRDSSLLSPEYRRDHAATRDPLVAHLPCGSDWCIDTVTMRGGVPGPNGWTVTGMAPLITVSPSIVVPGYHGFLQNGVLTDDLEGRRYP